MIVDRVSSVYFIDFWFANGSYWDSIPNKCVVFSYTLRVDVHAEVDPRERPYLAMLCKNRKFAICEKIADLAIDIFPSQTELKGTNVKQ